MALLIATLWLSPAYGGAWTKEFGASYTKVGTDFYLPGSYVDPTTGEKLEDLKFIGQQTSVYSEFGVLKHWPLQVSIQLPLVYGVTTFVDEVSFNEGDQARATSLRLGDVRLQVQAAILRKGFQLSGGVEIKVPLYANDGVGAKFGIWKAAFPLPGDGQLDVTPWVIMGGSIPGTPLFAQGGIGYRFRTERFIGWDTRLRFVDGLAFNGTVGLTTGPLLTLFQWEGIKNFKEDEVTRENLYLGGALMWTVWKGLAIETRAGGEVWADNAASGLSLGLGVSWRTPTP